MKPEAKILKEVSICESWSALKVSGPCEVSIWNSENYCPNCGRLGVYRSGYEFDHQMRCFKRCQEFAPVWEPGKKYLIARYFE